MGGAAPPEAGVLPSDAPRSEQVRDQAAHVADTATTQAGEVAATAAQQTKDVASTAMDKAAEVTHEATAQVRDLVSETTHQVRTQAEAQTTKLAEGIASLGDQLRALVDGRPEDAQAVRDYVQQGADRLVHVADRLQRQGLDGTIEEVQRYARRRPGMFLLGALGVGIGVGRLVRGAQAASSSSSSSPTSSPTGPAPAPVTPAPTQVRGPRAAPATGGYDVPPTDPTITSPIPTAFPTEPPAGGVR
jgi:hypothetical protein